MEIRCGNEELVFYFFISRLFVFSWFWRVRSIWASQFNNSQFISDFDSNIWSCTVKSVAILCMLYFADKVWVMLPGCWSLQCHHINVNHMKHFSIEGCKKSELSSHAAMYFYLMRLSNGSKHVLESAFPIIMGTAQSLNLNY